MALENNLYFPPIFYTTEVNFDDPLDKILLVPINPDTKVATHPSIPPLTKIPSPAPQCLLVIERSPIVSSDDMEPTSSTPLQVPKVIKIRRRAPRKFKQYTEKDASYWQYRKKNNEAARRSRANTKERNMQLLQMLEDRIIQLDKQNMKLKNTVSELTRVFEELKKLVIKSMSTGTVKH